MNPDHVGPFIKPVKHSGKAERRVAKDAKRIERDKAAKRDKLAQALANRALRFDVFTRDKGRCRAFGTSLYFEHPDPTQVGHCHHVVFRSAGGADTLDNLIYVSWAAHAMIHGAHTLEVTGHGNSLIHFVQKDNKGRVVRSWESNREQ